METIESLQNKLNTMQSSNTGYGADLPGEIESQLQKAWSPMLQEALGVSRDLRGDYLGKYFDITQMGPGMAGTTAKDLSPTQKLGVMGREMGYMVGDLERTQKYSDYLGGQMGDMQAKAMQSAQMGQQSWESEYNRTMQQLQMAQQLAEAEKDRALQREMAELSARSSRSPSGTVVNYNLGDGDNPPPPVINPEQQVEQAIKNIVALRQSTNIENNMNAYHDEIMRAALEMGIKLDPEDLWRRLGNTSKQKTSYTSPAAKYFDLTKL